jgi:4-hydroxybenzoate polyprenyltransferase/phosphoserine phosphatase
MDPQPPLVVDLDGTLVRTDMLHETLVGALQRSPWLILAMPFWLLRGRAALKRELALRSDVSAASLPYRAEVLDWVRSEHESGRRVMLATAADESIARRVADHVGAFDEILASDGERNVKGEGKRALLVERFGERGFDYAGNESADLGVWGSARCAIVVSSDPALFAAASRGAPQARQIAVVSSGWGAVGRAMRVQQWPKNLLVLVPLLTAHRMDDPGSIAAAAVSFLAFCLVASAIYIANDVLDLSSDRAHPLKRHRPFARGDLAIGWAFALVPLLIVASLSLTWRYGAALTAVVACYAVVGLLYSLRLKRWALVDVLVIAGLYSLRIFGGAVAIDVPLSDWLLGFSMFIFISVALAKRHAELRRSLVEGGDDCTQLPGRGYRMSDLPFIVTLGVATGLLSVAVFALYITGSDVTALYARPQLLWADAVLILYWISRIWMLAQRGTLGEDPLSFALRDRVSYVVGALMVLVVYFAI